jgi:hypothetical protein
MQGIAKAAADYANAHDDKMPQKISDLVPDYYLDDPKMLLFYSPDSNRVDDLDLTTHRELIDLFSAYGFLRLPDHRILVFERPGFRKNGMIYVIQGNDGRCFGYLSRCYASPKEFVQRLRQGFPDVPHEEDYQDLTESEIGPSEYELDIRGSRLQSVQKAFALSGKPPIDADAAYAKVQVAIEHLDASGTWRVEKGVRASDGSTPYYIFKCIYQKEGHEMGDSMVAYVLLDGSVLVPTKHPRPPGA